MHRTELGELGALNQACGRRAVHARDLAVFERDEVAPPQAREPHTGIAFGGQVAVGGEPYGAAVGARVEPAGDGGHEERKVLRPGGSGLGTHPEPRAPSPESRAPSPYISPGTCARITSATSASWPTSTTGNRRWPTGLSSSPARSTSASCASRCSTRWISSASAGSRSS